MVNRKGTAYADEGDKNEEISDSSKLDALADMMRDACSKMDAVSTRMDAMEERAERLDARMDAAEEEKRDDSEEEKEERKDSEEEGDKPKETAADRKDSEEEKEEKRDDSEEEKEERKDAKDDDETMADKVTVSRAELAAMRAEIDALKPRIPAILTDSQREAYAVIQEHADPAFQAFGDRAPAPLDGETPLQYKRRLGSKLQGHSQKWGEVRLGAIADEKALDVALSDIYADSIQAARHGGDVPALTLRPRQRNSGAGHTIIEYDGEPDSWMNNFAGNTLRATGGWNRPH